MNDKILTTEQQELLSSVNEKSLVYYPNRILHTKCDPVCDDEFNDELDSTIKDMFYTMKTHQGIGLAAPQIGLLKQIIIIHIVEPTILINPIIIAYGKEMVTTEEGCLSFPGYFKNVERYKNITVAYRNENGDTLKITATDMQAVVLQHEIDHIHGKLFVDDLSKLKLYMLKRKIKNNLKGR